MLFPDHDVLISSDSEGNSYAQLVEGSISVSSFVDSRWGPDIRYNKLTPELAAQGYTEEDIDPNAEPCFVIYPD